MSCERALLPSGARARVSTCHEYYCYMRYHLPTLTLKISTRDSPRPSRALGGRRSLEDGLGDCGERGVDGEQHKRAPHHDRDDDPGGLQRADRRRPLRLADLLEGSMNGFSASFGIPPAPPDPLFFSSWICAPRSLGAAVSGTGGCSPRAPPIPRRRPRTTRAARPRSAPRASRQELSAPPVPPPGAAPARVPRDPDGRSAV